MFPGTAETYPCRNVAPKAWSHSTGPGAGDQGGPMIVQSTPISSISPRRCADLLGVALEMGQARSRVAQDELEFVVALAGEAFQRAEPFVQFLGRRHRWRASGLGDRGGGGHRHPAVRVRRRALECGIRIAAHPDRDPVVPWCREGADVSRREVPPLEVERLTAPVQPHHLQRLLEESVALLEFHPEREVLRLEVPRSGAHVEAAFGHPVEGGRALGQEQGIAVRDDAQIGHKGQIGCDPRR